MNNFWQKLLLLDALVTEFVSLWRAADSERFLFFLISNLYKRIISQLFSGRVQTKGFL